MRPKPPELLVHEYIECQRVHAEIDFSSRASVKAGNKAADRMRLIATSLSASQAGQVAFEQLLTSPNPVLALWAAHHLLELMSPIESVQEAALALIASAAKGDSAHALGEAMWLESWHSARAT